MGGCLPGDEGGAVPLFLVGLGPAFGVGRQLADGQIERFAGAKPKGRAVGDRVVDRPG